MQAEQVVIQSFAKDILNKYREEYNSLDSYYFDNYSGIKHFRNFLKKLGLIEISEIDRETLQQVKDKTIELAKEENRANFALTIKEKILDWIVLCQEEGWRYELSKNSDGTFYFGLLNNKYSDDVDGVVCCDTCYETVTEEIERRIEQKRIKQEESNKKAAALNKLSEEEKKLLGLK